MEIETSAKFDGSTGKAELKDVLLNWKYFPRQSLTLGKQKEPSELESNQSSKQIATMERSMASSLFTPARNIGIVYSNVQSRHAVQLGVFEADHVSDDSGLAFSGRVTTTLVRIRHKPEWH